MHARARVYDAFPYLVFRLRCREVKEGLGGSRQTPLNPFITPHKTSKAARAAKVEGNYPCAVPLPATLMSALAFMSVIVGDYFNCEKVAGNRG